MLIGLVFKVLIDQCALLAFKCCGFLNDEVLRFIIVFFSVLSFIKILMFSFLSDTLKRILF